MAKTRSVAGQKVRINYEVLARASKGFGPSQAGGVAKAAVRCTVCGTVQVLATQAWANSSVTPKACTECKTNLIYVRAVVRAAPVMSYEDFTAKYCAACISTPVAELQPITDRDQQIEILLAAVGQLVQRVDTLTQAVTRLGTLDAVLQQIYSPQKGGEA